jgi:uncharacterized protein YbaP (TraB family)
MVKFNFKKSVSLGIIISLYLNLSAQTTGNNSLCWKVTGNGLSQPSYIFGTIHIISKKDFFLTKATENAFKTCKTLALEVDLNMDKETKKEIGKSALLPSGKVIDDYCTAEELSVITSFMTDTVKISSLKIKLYSRLKPMYLQSILLKEQIQADKSYEETFAKKAKKNKMNLVGLEAITLQMKIMDTIPVDTQVKDMVSSIKEGKASIRNFNEMIAVYKDQNIEKLHALTLGEDSGIANFEDVFLNNRNANWIPVIEGLIKKQPTFVAVGAAHLGGEKGVLNLLKLKGYIVEPIF